MIGLIDFLLTSCYHHRMEQTAAPDPETILYGDLHQFDPDEEEQLAQAEQKHYQGLPTLDMSLTASEAAENGELAEVLRQAQAVIDRMTGWDLIESDWYANAHDPNHPAWQASRNEAETEKKWRDDTRKRWKVGVLHHSVVGLIWCVHNDEHQVAGEWHSGTNTHVNTELHLGDLLGGISMPWVRKKTDQGERTKVVRQERTYPPGLRDWFARLGEEAAQQRFLEMYRLRSKA